ncbi:MAG: lantibiotic dehydratase [Brevibacillus sp.]|jgi:hypothetical protein
MNQTALAASVWTWFPHFVLRSTGFPFEWIGRMRMEETQQVLEAVFAWEEKRHRLVEQWERDVLPLLTDKAIRWEKPQQKVLASVYRKVKKACAFNENERAGIQAIGRSELSEWAHQWQETFQQEEQLYRQAEQVFAGEWERVREELHTCIAHPRFREAVFLSNPSFYERGFAYFDQHRADQTRDSRWRQLERQFFTYLQRFTAKNETASFFGPVNYGRIAEGEGTGTNGLITAQWPDTFALEKRVAFYAFWVLQELAALVAADPALADVVPLMFRGSSKQVQLEHFSEGMSVREWAKATGAAVEQTRQEVDRLIANSTLQRIFPIPSSVIHGLADLIERIGRLQAETEAERGAKERWLSVLRQLQRLQHQFEQGDLQERIAILERVETMVSDLTRLAPRRGEGELFRDRTVLYEDTRGNLTICLDRRMVDHLITDLYGPLKIATVYTTLRKERYMKIAMQIYRRMFGNRQAVRFDQFVVACHKLLPELADGAREHGDADDPLEEFLRIFHQSCDAYLAGHSPTLISPEFAAFLHKMKDDDLYLTSPDLLVMFDSGAKGGATAPTFVLGELHHGITMEGWMLSFHSDADRVREEIRQEIVRHLAIVQERSKRKILPANLIFNRKMKTAPQEYPGVMVEVSGYASTRRPDATFGLKDLVVRVDGDELVLTLRGDDRAIRFYPPAFGFTEQAYVPFALFSFPIVQMPTYRREGFTPRIETGHLVVQRAQWTLSTEDLQTVIRAKEPFSAYVAVQKVRRQYSLPRHVFLRVPSEQKPVYLDLENPYAVELLQHLAGKNETVTFSEMLPAPDQLWLRDRHGTYCSELRTLLMRS